VPEQARLVLEGNSVEDLGILKNQRILKEVSGKPFQTNKNPYGFI